MAVSGLKELRLHNFKSFSGDHIISEFDNHLTVIVGPNGSGKSNIIDSILFVLGYRAKKMRQPVLRDLISTGCHECSVELVFDGFRISRSLQAAGKSCTSKYSLDGRDVSFVEIASYVKERGIDLEHNRFLILQGEVENIALMGPHDLLEYIEDCVGTSVYKERIEGLTAAAEEAEMASASTKNELKFAKADFMFKKEKHDERKGFLQARQEALAMKSQIVSMKAEISRRKQVSTGIEMERMSSALEEEKSKNRKMEKELKELERCSRQLEGAVDEDRLLEMRKREQAITRENTRLAARREMLQTEIDEKQQKHGHLTVLVSEWESKAQGGREKQSMNMRQMEELKKVLEEKKRKFKEYKEIGQREEEKKKSEQLLVQMLKGREGVVRLEEEIKYLRDEIEKLNKASPSSIGLDAQHGIDLDKAHLKQAELERELGVLEKDMRATAAEIEKRRRRAAETKQADEAYRRESAVMDALGEVRGVCGRLRDLGQVEGGYEDAVEAATRMLGSVVVETAEAAEECVGIISARRLPRTTFIILDKIAEPRPDGDKRLLYKKMDCKPAHVKAFYFALKDTIVVRELEEAKKLAFGVPRRRVVTLDGQVLEKSGVMSGGRASKRVKSATELETVYAKIKQLYDTKRGELDGIAQAMENARLASDRAKRARELAKELGIKVGNLEKLGHGVSEVEITAMREKILAYDAVAIPAGAQRLRDEIAACMESMDELERMNGEIEATLRSDPRGAMAQAGDELRRLAAELDGIRMLEHDGAELRRMEKMREAQMEELRRLRGQISETRMARDRGYRAEAEMRSRIDECGDTLREAARISAECIEKSKAIADERAMVGALLGGSTGGASNGINDGQAMVGSLSHSCAGEAINDEQAIGKSLPHSYAGLGDDELRRESRALIDALSAKEAADFEKYSDASKTDSMEGVHVYRAIFQEYSEAKAAYETAQGAATGWEEKLGRIRAELAEMKSKRHECFMAGFACINKSLREIFSLITFGGTAELDLVDCLNPFGGGVVLSVMPPRKAWKQATNLSGGEKTLSSLSLIFSVHRLKPSAFYLMDEIDAALDYRNVGVISQYLKRIGSQFIVISLRDNMFESAKTLLGVYKTGEQSKALLVDVDKIAC